MKRLFNTCSLARVLPAALVFFATAPTSAAQQARVILRGTCLSVSTGTAPTTTPLSGVNIDALMVMSFNLDLSAVAGQAGGLRYPALGSGSNLKVDPDGSTPSSTAPSLGGGQSYIWLKNFPPNQVDEVDVLMACTSGVTATCTFSGANIFNTHDVVQRLTASGPFGISAPAGTIVTLNDPNGPSATFQLDEFCVFDPLWEGPAGPGGLGSNYCFLWTNSSGLEGTMRASGSTTAADNDLLIECVGLPSNQFGMFLWGDGALPIPVSTGYGYLCIGPSINRFVGCGALRYTGSLGRIGLQVDLTSLPFGNMVRSVMPGETLHFQCWYRDIAPYGAGFSDAIEVTFF